MAEAPTAARNQAILEDSRKGKSYVQIGREHGISVGRVRQIIYMGQRKLRKISSAPKVITPETLLSALEGVLSTRIYYAFRNAFLSGMSDGQEPTVAHLRMMTNREILSLNDIGPAFLRELYDRGILLRQSSVNNLYSTPTD